MRIRQVVRLTGHDNFFQTCVESYCHSACLQSEIEESRIEAEGGNTARSALVGSAATAFAKETVQAIAPFTTFCYRLNAAISLWNLP